MKNIASIFSVIFLLHLTACAQVNNSSNLPRVRIYDATHDFGPWVKRGKLVHETVALSPGELESYFYQDRSGHWFLLSNRIDGINEFLDDEIPKELAIDFLNERMSFLLLSTMSPAQSYIINDQFLNEFVNVGSLTNFQPFAGNSDFASIKKLQPYKSDAKPVVAGNDWKLDFNVATHLGGIEKWHVTGQVAPLLVRSFCREIAEPNGTFTPFSETGNQ
jgi:hypothetical protein